MMITSDYQHERQQHVHSQLHAGRERGRKKREKTDGEMQANKKRESLSSIDTISYKTPNSSVRDLAVRKTGVENKNSHLFTTSLGMNK